MTLPYKLLKSSPVTFIDFVDSFSPKYTSLRLLLVRWLLETWPLNWLEGVVVGFWVGYCGGFDILLVEGWLLLFDEEALRVLCSYDVRNEDVLAMLESVSEMF